MTNGSRAIASQPAQVLPKCCLQGLAPRLHCPSHDSAHPGAPPSAPPPPPMPHLHRPAFGLSCTCSPTTPRIGVESAHAFCPTTLHPLPHTPAYMCFLCTASHAYQWIFFFFYETFSKIFYLLYISSVLRTDCTVVFYMMR